jgi:tRNA pseudouridine(38-40) synthase
VHALAQVAQIDLAREVATDKLRDAINFHLKPLPVAVLRAELAPEGFHARFSARMRRYRYRILNRRAPLVLDAGRAWRVPQSLDAQAMNQAAQHLVGRHDFTSFRATLCQAQSPVKTLDRLSIERSGKRSSSWRRRGPFSTTRCGTWSGVSSWWVRAGGRKPIWCEHWRLVTAAPPARQHRPSAFT